MSKVVVVSDLWKFFGSKPALSGLNFEVDESEVFGLIGPNGAGKTTCFRILATVLKPSKGSARVFGHDVVAEANQVRSIISYLPEDAGVYKNLTGLEFLKLTARLYGDIDDDRLSMGLEIANLGEAIKDRMSTYSKGMRQRILLARTLMVEPKLAILDEPTAGLDVEHAVYVRNIIKNYSRRGITFLVSSHNMLEVTFLCTRVAIIHEGRIIEEGEPRALLTKYGVENLEELFIMLRRRE